MPGRHGPVRRTPLTDAATAYVVVKAGMAAFDAPRKGVKRQASKIKRRSAASRGSTRRKSTS